MIGVCQRHSEIIMYDNSLYVAHIHRGGEDCGSKWNNLVRANVINVLALFNPSPESGSMAVGCGIGDSVCGVITPDNRCFSVIVDESDSTAVAIQEWTLQADSNIIPLQKGAPLRGQSERKRGCIIV